MAKTIPGPNVEGAMLEELPGETREEDEQLAYEDETSGVETEDETPNEKTPAT